MNAIATILIML